MNRKATLTAVGEVDVIDVAWPLGDVIEARDCDVTSAEETRRSAQDSLKPAGSAVARQRVALHSATRHQHTYAESPPRTVVLLLLALSDH